MPGHDFTRNEVIMFFCYFAAKFQTDVEPEQSPASDFLDPDY